jgi:aspartate aminotransferase
MSSISRRVGAITESATLAVDAKAKALQAAGGRRRLALGDPTSTPAHHRRGGGRRLRDPATTSTRPRRCPDWAAIAREKTARDSGYLVDPGQVVVTNGGKHAVYNAFQTLLDPGDEVIIPAPYWTTYPEAVKLADGVPVDVFAP